MKKLFFIALLFLSFTSAYAVKTNALDLNTKPAALSNEAAKVCCEPDTDLFLDKGNFLLVLAGCGIGVFGINKYRDNDLNE